MAGAVMSGGDHTAAEHAATRRLTLATGSNRVRAGVLAAAISVTAGLAASTYDDGYTPSCVDDGDRVCGPGNAEHVPAGCYDDGGVFVAPWPCAAWKPADGWRHGDGSVTYGQDGDR
jgi:hypothetical protein